MTTLWSLEHTHPGANTAALLGNLGDAISTFYSEETDLTGLPNWLQPASGPLQFIANQATPAITLAQWFEAQTVGYSGPGLTADDPYIVQVDQTNREDVITNLGGNANIDPLLKKYKTKTRWNPSIRNTFYNWAPYGLGGIRWDEETDELVYFDRYNFEGIGDFGLSAAAATLRESPVKNILAFFGAIATVIAIAPPATAVALARQTMILQGFNPNNGEFSDGEPISSYGADFSIFRRGDYTIGNMRNLFIELRFTKEELCEHNPALYKDAVAKGYLKFHADVGGSCAQVQARAECFDATENVIPVGNAQPMALLGFPYYPPNVSQMYAMSTYNFGVSNKYPSPFTSYIQQTYNTANYLGAYAMWGPIAGRLILIQSGSYSGEIGFIAQCWDNFDDGPNNVDGDGIQYPSKLEWWNTCEYEIKTVRNLLFAEQPPAPVKVAIKSFNGPGDDDVWRPSWNPSASPFGTVALGALVALAALAGRFLR